MLIDPYPLRLFGVATLAALVSACGSLPMDGSADVAKTKADQVAEAHIEPLLTPRFAAAPTGAQGLRTAAKICFSDLPPTAIDNWSSKLETRASVAQVMSNNSRAGFLINAGGRVACVRESVHGHAILASEAFTDTVDPMGVPAEVREDWNKQLARQLARTGTASAFYHFANGNGVLVQYWLNPANRGVLFYADTFKKAGEALPNNVTKLHDRRFAAYRVTEYGKQKRKVFTMNMPNSSNATPAPTITMLEV